MAGGFCLWWNCPLEEVTDWQNENCMKNGMCCIECPSLSENVTANNDCCEESVNG